MHICSIYLVLMGRRRRRADWNLQTRLSAPRSPPRRPPRAGRPRCAARARRVPSPPPRPPATPTRVSTQPTFLARNATHLGVRRHREHAAELAVPPLAHHAPALVRSGWERAPGDDELAHAVVRARAERDADIAAREPGELEVRGERAGGGGGGVRDVRADEELVAGRVGCGRGGGVWERGEGAREGGAVRGGSVPRSELASEVKEEENDRASEQQA